MNAHHTPDPAQQLPLPIVFADEHLLVVDKPSGIPSVPARSRLDPPSSIERLKPVWGDLEAAHRLDRDTAGLLVLARTPASRAFLGRAFESRAVRKRYLAIVHGAAPAAEGIIHMPLADDPWLPPRKRIDPLLGKRATSRWWQLAGAEAAAGPVSLLALEPVTGRSHQLRVHLSWLGVPIVGDRLYGPRSQPLNCPQPRLALCAAQIDFPHPANGRRIRLEAVIPTETPWTLFDPTLYSVGCIADPLTCDQ